MGETNGHDLTSVFVMRGVPRYREGALDARLIEVCTVVHIVRFHFLARWNFFDTWQMGPMHEMQPWDIVEHLLKWVSR